MTLLFIPSLLSGDFRSFAIKSGVVVLFWFIVIIASMVDLIAGIAASRRTGDYKTHSYGLRKTLIKDLQYFGVLVMLLLIDVITSALGDYIALFQIPIASIAGVLCITIIEALSVRENIQRGRSADENKIDDIEAVAKVIVTLIGTDKAKATMKKVEEIIENKKV